LVKGDATRQEVLMLHWDQQLKRERNTKHGTELRGHVLANMFVVCEVSHDPMSALKLAPEEQCSAKRLSKLPTPLVSHITILPCVASAEAGSSHHDDVADCNDTMPSESTTEE
jgi:hypothetical protein